MVAELFVTISFANHSEFVAGHWLLFVSRYSLLPNPQSLHPIPYTLFLIPSLRILCQ